MFSRRSRGSAPPAPPEWWWRARRRYLTHDHWFEFASSLLAGCCCMDGDPHIVNHVPTTSYTLVFHHTPTTTRFPLFFSSPHHSARQQAHGQVQARRTGNGTSGDGADTSGNPNLTTSCPPQNVALVRIVPNKE